MLSLREASFSFKDRRVFSNVTFNLHKNEVLCLLGRNGCGKSTLLNCISKFYRTKNMIYLNNIPLEEYSYAEYAKCVSTVSQNNYFECNFDVMTIILMGRAPYNRLWESPSKKDIDIVRYYMTHLKIEQLEKKCFSSLSIGQQKMVLIAQSLVKKTQMLIFDEPTAPLDLHNKVLFMNHLKEIAHERTIIFSSHDPNDAIGLSSKAMLFLPNRILFDDAEKILTPDNLSEAYGINANIVEVEGEKMFIYK